MKNRHIYPNQYLKVGLLILLGIVLAAPMFAQSGALDRETLGSLERLRFSEEEIAGVTAIQEAYYESRLLPAAELEVLRAQMQREMLSDEPSLREIENLIREGLDYEVDLRMSEIRREFEMQDLLGARRWAQMKQFARQLSQRQVDLAALSERVRASRPDLLPALRVMLLYAGN